jgi:hypothetical protein
MPAIRSLVSEYPPGLGAVAKQPIGTPVGAPFQRGRPPARAERTR